MSEPLKLSQSIIKNGVMLALFSSLCVGLVVYVNSIARPGIELNKQKILQNSLQEILPATVHNNNLLQDTYKISPNNLLANSETKTAYIAWQNDAPVAVILPVTAPEGYGGAIQLIVGIYVDGTVSGVRVIPPHAETPGLGDKIEIKKSDWVFSFNGKSLLNLTDKAWAVKKDGGQFDAFIGATITPRAIISAVHNALIYFQQNKQIIFKKAAP